MLFFFAIGLYIEFTLTQNNLSLRSGSFSHYSIEKQKEEHLNCRLTVEDHGYPKSQADTVFELFAISTRVRTVLISTFHPYMYIVLYSIMSKRNVHCEFRFILPYFIHSTKEHYTHDIASEITCSPGIPYFGSS